MVEIFLVLKLILDVCFWILLAYVIMSWLISFQVLNLRQPVVAQIWFGLNKLLEPLFSAVRRFLPDTHPLDLAPLVIFVALIALRDIVLPGLLL